LLEMLRKIISGGQTGADRAALDFAIEKGLEHGGYVPRGRKAEDGRIDDRYNLVELSTSSYPARTRRNIEESDGTVIFSLERLLSGGTKLTWEHANKLGKPALHIYNARKERIINQDSLRLEIQALTDFLCSNKIEILNVAGSRELTLERGLNVVDRCRTGHSITAAIKRRINVSQHFHSFWGAWRTLGRLRVDPYDPRRPSVLECGLCDGWSATSLY